MSILHHTVESQKKYYLQIHLHKRKEAFQSSKYPFQQVFVSLKLFYNIILYRKTTKQIYETNNFFISTFPDRWSATYVTGKQNHRIIASAMRANGGEKKYQCENSPH